MTSPAPTTWRGGLVLALLSVLFTGALLEAGLRVKGWLDGRAARAEAGASRTPAGEYWAIYDPDLGYRQNPRFGDLNADGLRDHPVGPKAGRRRVLILGDSIAQYGDSVDDTLVAYMRQDLERRHRYRNLQVINAATRGYTNYQQIRYLEKYGVRFEPDVVGIQFGLNDLHRFLHGFTVENGRIVGRSYTWSAEAIASAPNPPRPLAAWLSERSRLLAWLRHHAGLARTRLALAVSGGYPFERRIDVISAWRDESWKQIEEQLARAAALGRKNGFTVFVAMVPMALQYDERYLARDRSYVLKPQRKLREICERLSIPFYDLYPDMHAGLFRADDGMHLTAQGRRFVGGRLAAFFADSAWIPKDE